MAPSALSPLYTRWIEAAVGASFASEPGATCGDCAMCRPSPGALAPVFDGAVKCCTYWPDLPNYLVGAALREPGEGAARLRRAIGGRIGLTPLAMESAPGHHRHYKQVGADGFGRDHALTCPYLDAGGCTLWATRNAVCQTWFCKVEDGLPGSAAWRQLANMLLFIEERLSISLASSRLQHADFYQIMFESNGRRTRVSGRGLPGWIADDGALSPELHARLWGPWAGREEAFYLDCAAEAETLDWSEIQRRAGPELLPLTQRLRTSMMTTRTPPPRLRPATPGVEIRYEAVEHGVAFTSVRDGLHVGLASQALWEQIYGDPEQEQPPVDPAELDDELRRALWRDGLLVEGAAGEPRPVEANDQLRVVPGLELTERILFSPEGQATVMVSAGATELTFDDPPLLGLGRQLVARQSGFVAGEAMGWAEGKVWEELAELLNTLVGMGILERVVAEGL